VRFSVTSGVVLLATLWVSVFAVRPAVPSDEPEDSWVGTYSLLTGDQPASIAISPGQYRISKQMGGYRLERTGDAFFTPRTLLETKQGVLTEKGGGLELAQGALEFPGDRRIVLKPFCGYLLRQQSAKPKK